MSWSFTGVGKPKAVAAAAKKALMNYKCAEPEEDIKTRVIHMLEVALQAYPDSAAVEVTAHGSQTTGYDTHIPHKQLDGHINSLHIEIKPLWGFVE
jgi:hypothetical protein